MIKYKYNYGFTMMELVIYIAIIGIAMVSFVGFSVNIIQGKTKNNISLETQYNARIALVRMTQEIRSATGINSGDSIFNADPGVLSLSCSDPLKNPTIISLDADDGVLQIKYGADAPIPITTTSVRVTELQFINQTQTSGKGTVKMEITVENIAGAEQNYQSTVNLISVANIRK